MKRLKFITAAMACVAVLGFTFASCDDDDEVHQLTQQEKETAFNAVKGDYNGKLTVPQKEGTPGTGQPQTRDISWSITAQDAMTIHQFPMDLLAEYVTNDKVKQALAAAAPQDIKCSIGFYSVSPAGFLINPTPPQLELTLDGTPHKVQVAFFINSNYSFGHLINGDKTLQMQIVEADIYVDGQPMSYLQNGVPFVMTAQK
ncbi:DUF4840 domain-containing protein [Prevotella sp. kh1p2]|uniref:DUF4840 domain-containing protein n=1 Tax=Prevotella sp. kh1p2 TaxID=1761883 RepID=UPI0008D2CAB9|nr:DUF4840 domain-containing protein [Prevotella sp. kh1p2]SES87008.1 protein of unknown function [Prevotella sp. kh1p2]SNU11123.1 protein of unknown function [Prevotellaceae bacterium KH2P17]